MVGGHPDPHTIARRGRETGSGSTGDGEEQGRKVYTRDARRPTDGYSYSRRAAPAATVTAVGPARFC